LVVIITFTVIQIIQDSHRKIFQHLNT